MLDEQQRLSSMNSLAKKRFDIAHAELLLTRRNLLNEVKSRHSRLESARVAERIRAAVIAALPHPPPDPIELHVCPNGDMSALRSREYMLGFN